TNDGTGSFTEMPNVPFEQVAFGSIAFADVNNDTYPDVLITGENAESDAVSVLYTNDGTGDFTEVADTPFEAVENSSIAFADIDNNSTPDVLITGKSRAKLYTNMGGVFTEVVDTPFDGVDRSSVAIADINNDNFVDVLITGEASGLGTPSAKLYLNNGVITSVAESGSDQSLQTLLFPNPTNNGGITLRQQAKKDGYLNIRLLDSSGRMLNTQQKWLVAGQNNLLFEYQNLPSGVYYLHLNDGRHSGVSKMIVH
ncbi:MAG: T9SS type A sorting domain-containing protein, partial [Saprospiraceae bacterium]|nr:T9SS type A sorting domain-containing protein [Saprospiraceae bacterium]